MSIKWHFSSRKSFNCFIPPFLLPSPPPSLPSRHILIKHLAANKTNASSDGACLSSYHFCSLPDVITCDTLKCDFLSCPLHNAKLLKNDQKMVGQVGGTTGTLAHLQRMADTDERRDEIICAAFILTRLILPNTYYLRVEELCPLFVFSGWCISQQVSKLQTCLWNVSWLPLAGGHGSFQHS